MIDIFSKQAYAKPLINKSEKVTFEGFKELIKDNNLSPLVIQSDNGPEFTNKILIKI